MTNPIQQTEAMKAVYNMTNQNRNKYSEYVQDAKEYDGRGISAEEYKLFGEDQSKSLLEFYKENPTNTTAHKEAFEYSKKINSIFSKYKENDTEGGSTISPKEIDTAYEEIYNMLNPKPQQSE